MAAASLPASSSSLASILAPPSARLARDSLFRYRLLIPSKHPYIACVAQRALHRTRTPLLHHPPARKNTLRISVALIGWARSPKGGRIYHLFVFSRPFTSRSSMPTGSMGPKIIDYVYS